MQKFIILTCLFIPILSLITSCQGTALKQRPNPPPQTIVTENSPWLGLTLKESRTDAESQLIIDDLYWDSPAHRAGLKPDDILIELAGQEVDSIKQVLSFIQSTKATLPNETIKLKVLRPTQNITLTNQDKKENLTAGEFLTQYQKILMETKPGGTIKIEASNQNTPLDFSITLTKTPQLVRKKGLSPDEKIMPVTKRAWMGVRMDDINDLTPFGGTADAKGVKVIEVVSGAPAEKAGIKNNDLITGYDNQTFSDKTEPPGATLREYVKEHRSGDIITLHILREDNNVSAALNGKNLKVPPEKIPEQITNLKNPSELLINLTKNFKQVDIPVTLGAQNIVLQADQTAVDWTNDSFHPELNNYTTPFEQTVRQVLTSTNITGQYNDLIKRFTDDEKWEDAFRLKEIKYLHRDPFKIEKISSDLIDNLRRAGRPALAGRTSPPEAGQSPQPDFPSLITQLAKKIDAFPNPLGINSKLITSPSLNSGVSLEEHITQIEKILEQAVELRHQALAGLTVDDLEFLSTNIYNFAELDERKELKPETEKKVLELVRYINYEKLVQSAQTLAALINSDYLEGLYKDIESQPDKPLIFSKDTKWGKIIIGGRGDNRYAEPVALIIDLAGNDFYADNAGASSLVQPVSLIIDFSGNDRYSSSVAGAQGCGFLGVSILADLSGDDDYIGQQWAQGTGLLGVGLLYDKNGADNYRGDAYAQGAGLFGIGIIVDADGNDYYESNLYAQGFGSTKGVGLLLDDRGNDTYYATGKYPSGYTADSGTFTGLSQGAGHGVRKGELSRSGGIGILIDNQGQDHYEAGTFSQGGGYYFAWGILADGGAENDTYIGTRYAQGFSAHSALGFFMDEGGDDYYSSWIGVHAGLAWDLCSTVFIDKKGDDIYAPAGGFSLGAAAHNSFTLFYDAQGKDSYLCPVDKNTGGNSYHGGYSLSVFLDEDSSEDKHLPSPLEPDTIEVAPSYSIVFNLTKKLSELPDEEIKNILKDLTKKDVK
ncbi:MAG: PDZ domain-containing protein [Planctomycetota bacterium]